MIILCIIVYKKKKHIWLKTVWTRLNPGPTLKLWTYKYVGLTSGPVLITLVFRKLNEWEWMNKLICGYS